MVLEGFGSKIVRQKKSGSFEGSLADKGCLVAGVGDNLERERGSRYRGGRRWDYRHDLYDLKGDGTVIELGSEKRLLKS